MAEIKYDFDTVYDRRSTDSVKWAVGENELPMWVADMDFRTAPEVLEAIAARAEHGIFGYTDVTGEWYDAYAGWWEKRHGLRMEREGLIFVTGVVAAISSAVRKLTTPNENVVVQTPVYNIFFNSIVNNGRRVLESPLVYRDGEYSVDFDDLEKKLADPQTTLMILCNPHNPVGKIWDAATLAKIGELCRKHHVTVISDEIHCDVTVPGKSYIPFASVSDNCAEISVTCVAPTKTFNLAGIQTAAAYVPDPALRHKIRRAVNTDEVAEPNAFATVAAVAAFTKGGDWADAMNRYVAENRALAGEFIKENLPTIRLVDAEATYLLWIDVSDVGRGNDVAARIRKATGLYVTGGGVYGRGGEGFIRMNAACPRALLLDGLSRLRNGINYCLNSPS
ncbi:MAG: pyridoxal phosphate-dependent aminotransferase [Clostridia bacterium]|nr:pyridoxal phosphate-dependent aminotransferase [Clostridia bacterium]